MIQRREFLTTFATACAVTSLPKWATAKDGNRTLNWRSKTIQTVAKTSGNRAPVVTGVSLRPESNEIAIVGDDHYISVYDQTLNRFTQHLNEHEDWIRAARYSPAGDRLVTAGNDRRVISWSADKYDLPTLIATHPEAVIEVAFNSDGTRLGTVGFERSLRIYDCQTTQLLQKLECAWTTTTRLLFPWTDNSSRRVAGVAQFESGKQVLEPSRLSSRLIVTAFVQSSSIPTVTF